MPALARGQASNCANPQLDVFTAVNGVLTDVYQLEFQIFDVSDAAKQLNPVQVYAVTIGQRATVSVGISCPNVGAGKISTGRFLAQWTPGLAEPLGTHRVKWFFKLTSGSPEQTYQEEFEVLPEATASGEEGYAFVADMRDEGVTTEMASDAYLLKRIALASRIIDRVTGRFFSPRTLTLKLDGRGGRMLLLDVPIISIESVEFESIPFEPPTLVVESTSYRVYNRHLSMNLTQPDDRNNPKIELVHPEEYHHTAHDHHYYTRFVFPHGQQNVVVKGVFGFTDYDGMSSTGVIPPLINHACKLLVMRELYKMADVGRRNDAMNRNRLTSERTRDQAYTLEGLGTLRGAFLTGDPEIDHILASFMRPPALGAT